MFPYASLKVFWQMFISELGEIKYILKDKLIDNLMYVGCFVIMFGYIMPYPDQGAAYGTFVAVSMAASLSFWDVALSAYTVLMDFEGNRVITYDLVMPLPTTWVFLKKIAVSAVKGMIVGMYAIPLGKLILWDQFVLSNIDPVRLFVIFITGNIFFGSFGLCLVSFIPSVAMIESVFARLLMPMHFFGAVQFSWMTLFKLSPIAAYAMFLNPLVFSMEGMRAAVIGQEGFLPFWNCVAALWLFALVCGTWGITRLKKRLDCVD